LQSVRFQHKYASIAGFPAVIVAISLTIAAGKDEIHSFVDDE